MSPLRIFVLCISILCANNAGAYGSSSSKKACTKPKFSEFTPPHLSDVSPQSDFSFTASSVTLPDTIKVSAKKTPLDVNVSKKNNQFLVTGTLPENLKGTHARISIQASGPKKCLGKGGWLLNIKNE